MATLKYTFLFDWQSRAGWTETFYSNESGSSDILTQREKARLFGAERARVLTAGATVLVARVSDVLTPRRVTIVPIATRGALGQGLVFENIQPDVVNVAHLVAFNTGGQERRHYLMRGLDDRDVNDGKIDYRENGAARYNRFFNFIRDNNWAMRDMLKDPPTQVTSVTGTSGIVKVANAANLVGGNLCVLQSRTVGNGLKVNWQGRITDVVLNDVYLKGYRYGDAVGGQLWKITPSYPDLQGWVIPVPNWARTRQTGRPFFLPRGRQPKRT